MRPVLLPVLLLLIGCPGPEGDSTTLYVDSEAGGSGDGSEARPFATLGEAMTAAGAMEDPLVLVAPGTYAEALQYAVRKVTVAGHGGNPVVGDGVYAAFTIEAGATVELRDMTVAGVAVTGSTLALRDVTFSGLPLTASGADLELERVDSTGLAPSLTGGTLLARGLTLGGVEGDAALLSDVDAIIIGAVVQDVTAPTDGIAIGLNLVGGQAVLRNSTFTNIGTRGLRVEAGLAEVHDSTFTGIELTAIAYSKDADGFGAAGVVSGCEFADNETDVMVSGSDVIVRDSHFVGTRTFAVVGSDNGTVRVDRNHFEGLLGTAVTFIAPLASTVTWNTIEGADEGGIAVQQALGQVLVAYNEIHGVRTAGISFSWADNALVAYNTITDVGLDLWFNTLGEGISMMDARGDVFGNEITDPEGIGINLNRVDGQVFDNTIIGGLGGGIQVSGIGLEPPLRITGNVSQQNVGFGVLAMEADVVISGNDLSHNDYSLDGFGDGVALMTDTTAEITDNTCTGNQASGIMVIDNVTATIDGNSLINNDVYGIWVHCENEAIPIRASDVDILHNEFDGNSYGEIHGCY